MNQATTKACVDIGGTKVAVTLARSDHTGDHLLPDTRCTAPTVKTGARDALVGQVLQLLDESLALARQQGQAPGPVTAVGISSCGPFVLVDGAVELAAPNICGGLAGGALGLPNDWTTALLEAPLRTTLQARLPATQPLVLRVENDCVAALEAERLWGALQGLDHCAYVTWSTGIGAGLCVGGKILRGKNGNAGHAGHFFVSDDASGAQCGCGNLGDVEALVAGSAIERRLGISARQLLDAAAAGDAAALREVDALCRVLGRALYNMVVLLDLQAISLGGSVFLHHQALLLPRLQAQVTGRMAALTDGCILVPAGLGAQVGDYAALALASDVRQRPRASQG